MRSREWLAITFLPLFTTFYLLLLLAPAGRPAMLRAFVLLLLFGYCCSSFAFVLNTWTDRQQDRRAQKRFAVTDWRDGHIALLIVGLTLGCALALVLLLAESRERGLALSLAGLAYLLSVLYSAPPVRLKERGWLGPLTIAVSEFTLPQLLLFAALAELDPLGVLIAVLFGITGLRMILLHQILDHANDAVAGVETLALRHGVERMGKLVFGVLFPLEMLLVAAILVLLEARLRGALLAGLAAVLFFVAWSRLRSTRGSARMPVFFTAPFDFYWFLGPVLVLVCGLTESPIFLPLLAFHLVISRSVWSTYWEDLRELPARAAR